MNAVLHGESLTGGRVFRNTVWNLLGALLPIPAALVCIPLLVNALGLERFGLLGVAWMVMGYFGMFDFGLGQSTTRFVAARLANREHHTLRSLTCGSLLLHTALGMTGGLTLALLVPYFAQRVFAVPPGLIAEARTALYWLAASVPAIVMTAAIRGALEGMQGFDAVNLLRFASMIVN